MDILVSTYMLTRLHKVNEDHFSKGFVLTRYVAIIYVDRGLY